LNLPTWLASLFWSLPSHVQRFGLLFNLAVLVCTYFDFASAYSAVIFSFAFALVPSLNCRTLSPPIYHFQNLRAFVCSCSFSGVVIYSLLLFSSLHLFVWSWYQFSICYIFCLAWFHLYLVTVTYAWNSLFLVLRFSAGVTPYCSFTYRHNS
jgi:hypothetical protein